MKLESKWNDNVRAISISRKPRTSSCTTFRMCGTSVKMRNGRKQRRIISRCGRLIAATFSGRQKRSVRLTCVHEFRNELKVIRFMS